ncbi:MAG: DNA gyrase subunit A [Candidatus ainarchaeum sp.]|nr:DNA gyrase subunit A [Candidatus ainarchaeum sp.]MDD5096586.1 DNA gyrase subunit A [Candidatus ainarchaeum sp.]
MPLTDIPIEEDMKSSYLDYAMSVITSRALPDVRDGLKPVQRRILFAMHELGNTHSKPYKKSARVVGEVLGKYHPHGDMAIYDALVRMAQDFSLRAPLVDGQGNFGSVDGDSPAAMRYTEVRMAELAGEMLKDIEKKTVKFTPNFDGTLEEPTVLPSRIPNLLLNGSAGIAVGMATNIPPHNLSEIADAIISIIEGGTEEDVLRIVQGPDFPTGGSIIGKSQIINAYKTGRGIITVRGKAAIEKNEITILEIPYQVNKTALIGQIVSAVKEKRIEGISNVSDRSDRDGMALVIEVKRGEDPEIVLNQLYSFSDLQKSFGIQNLALVGGQPRMLPLIEMLREFISFRREIIIARSKFDLAKAQERLHLLEGFLVALANIDAVISLIRASRNAEEARGKLSSAYKLSDKQGAAILDMKLQKLTGLERHGIETEHGEKQEEIRKLHELLADEKKIFNVVKEEMLELRAKYGQPRRTMVEEGEAEVEIESLIPDEQVVVTISRKGYIKRVPLAEYRAQHRGGVGKIGAETVEEDAIEDVFVTTNHKYILFFTDKGKVHWLKAYRIPEAGRYSHGKPIVNLLRAEGEQVTASIAVDEFKDSEFFFMATRLGTVKRVETSSFSNPRKGGIIAITLREGDSLIAVRKTNGSQGLCLGTRKGYAIHFREEDVRGVGRSAAGVRGIRLRKGDKLVSATVTGKQFLLTITENGYGKKTAVAEYRMQGRGGLGIINMKAGARNGDIVNVRCVDDGEDAIVTTASGMIIRVPVGQISTVGRNTLGVRVIKLREGEKVSSFTTAPSEQVAGEGAQ